MRSSVSAISKSLLSAVPRLNDASLAMEQLPLGHVGRIEEAAIKNPFSRMAHRSKREKLIREMARILFNSKAGIHRYTNDHLFGKDAQYVLSLQEIEYAVELTKSLTRSEVPQSLADQSRSAIVEAILRPTSDTHCGIRVRRLHDHIDWLKDRHGQAGSLVKVLDILGYDNDDTGVIDDLDTLVGLMDHDFLNDEDQPQDMKRAYLLAAAESDENEDRIEEYALSRGGFDDAGFREYMNATSPLAGGAL